MVDDDFDFSTGFAEVVPEEVIVPKLIFIIPYRDREQQQRFFTMQMARVLEDYDKKDYMYIFAHQKDDRDFNRGALKNLGFLYAKSLYPNHYKTITIVFNDIDTMPYSKGFLKYETVPGVVKHFYGYHFTLGGIVSITGGDFENINGFPCYWAWGYEDNALNNRVTRANIKIDRSQFYPILDTNILQLKDGITRIVNRGEFDKYVEEAKSNNHIDGLKTLKNIEYSFNEKTSFLDITKFDTLNPPNSNLNKNHDMRDGNVPFLRQRQQKRRGGSMNMVFGVKR
jgi:hypothetical protein